MINKFELLNSFIAAVLNKMPEAWGEPRTYSGMEVVEILWPLNDFFRPQLVDFEDYPYQPELESKADEAILSFVMDGSDAWQEMPIGVWRVLVERHTQSLMLAASNELSNPDFLTLPKALPQQAVLLAAMIFLMYQMKLPFSVRPLSANALPPAGTTPSQWLH